MDKKIHIGFICHEYPPCKHGGIGSFTKDLAESLYRLGHDVTVIGFYANSILPIGSEVDEVINGVRVLRYPQNNKFSSIPLNTLYLRFSLYRKLKTLHKQKTFDLIESPGGSGWLPFGLPCSIPLVTRLHGGEVYTAFQLGKRMPRLIKFLERKQLKVSDEVVSVSKYTVETIFNLLQIKKDYEVIYNSVNDKLFHTKNEMVNVQKNLIVFAGTIKKAKGVEELIKAANIVLKVEPSARFILAGKMTKYDDLRTYEEYLRTILSTEFQDKVSFTGALDRETQLIPLLKSAEICCLPSYVESFSLAPLEAMALEKSVIFTQLTSGPEAIVDGESGLLCNPKDPQDIAEKILLLLKNKELRLQLGENGKNRILEKFTFKTWIKRNIAFYYNIVGL